MPRHLTIQLSNEIYEILVCDASREGATPDAVAKETLTRVLAVKRTRVGQYSDAYEESLSREGSNPWVPRCFPEEHPIDSLL